MKYHTSVVEQRVYYADTDHGGVAYYASYLRWFEIGRTELLRELGILQDELFGQGILLPVAQVKCEYKSPAVHDDILTIHTTIEKIGNKSIFFVYEVRRKKDGALLANGHTVNVFARANVSVEIPPPVRAKLEKR